MQQGAGREGIRDHVTVTRETDLNKPPADDATIGSGSFALYFKTNPEQTYTCPHNNKAETTATYNLSSSQLTNKETQ